MAVFKGSVRYSNSPFIMASITPAQALTISADAAYLSSRPLPIAPTGYYDWEVSSKPADKRQGHSIVSNLVNRVSLPSSSMFPSKQSFTFSYARSRRLSIKVDSRPTHLSSFVQCHILLLLLMYFYYAECICRFRS
jgi:hypothetical protein